MDLWNARRLATYHRRCPCTERTRVGRPARAARTRRGRRLLDVGPEVKVVQVKQAPFRVVELVFVRLFEAPKVFVAPRRTAVRGTLLLEVAEACVATGRRQSLLPEHVRLLRRLLLLPAEACIETKAPALLLLLRRCLLATECIKALLLLRDLLLLLLLLLLYVFIM